MCPDSASERAVSRPMPVAAPVMRTTSLTAAASGGHALAEVVEGLAQRHHVGVLLLEVEQRLVVRRRRAVADRLANHDRAEPELNGVNGARTNAPARGAPREDQRIHPGADQP